MPQKQPPARTAFSLGFIVISFKVLPQGIEPEVGSVRHSTTAFGVRITPPIVQNQGAMDLRLTQMLHLPSAGRLPRGPLKRSRECGGITVAHLRGHRLHCLPLRE